MPGQSEQRPARGHVALVLVVKLDELPDYMVGPDLPNTIRREFTKQLPAFVQRVRVELAREARR